MATAYYYANSTVVPVAYILILQFFDINILIFATILAILGLFIDFLIYLNSAPVELPYEREHFIRSAIKATVRWIGWSIIFWLLCATICAIDAYIGFSEAQYIIEAAGLILLSTIVLYDLRKLKYTRFYYFKPVKHMVDTVCRMIECEFDEDPNHDHQKKQSKNG